VELINGTTNNTWTLGTAGYYRISLDTGAFTVTVTDLPPSPPTVTAVSIDGGNISLEKGETHAFTATVSGTNNPAQTVAWSIEGTHHTGTAITDGTLAISIGETETTLTIRATSTADTTKYGEITVTVTDLPPPPPTVTAVSIDGGNISLEKGETHAFTATVSGTNNPAQTVVWSIEGAHHTGTTITDGTLAISIDEAETTLTIRATSTADTTKYGEIMVTVIPVGAVTIGLTIVDEGGILNLGKNPDTAVIYKSGNPNAVTLSVTNNGYTYTWYVDGRVKGTGSSITLNAGDYAPGGHSVFLGALNTETDIPWSSDSIAFTVLP
jgi:hypothetical protein